MPERQAGVGYFLQKGCFCCGVCMFVYFQGVFLAFYQMIFTVVESTPKTALGKDAWPMLGLDAQHCSG